MVVINNAELGRCINILIEIFYEKAIPTENEQKQK